MALGRLSKGETVVLVNYVSSNKLPIGDIEQRKGLVILRLNTQNN